jgi:hypothetical protein
MGNLVYVFFLRENRKGKQELAIQRHWQHWLHKTNKTQKQNITQKTKKMSNTDPAKSGVNPGARGRLAVPASCKSAAILLIWTIRVGYHYANTNTKGHELSH